MNLGRVAFRSAKEPPFAERKATLWKKEGMPILPFLVQIPRMPAIRAEIFIMRANFRTEGVAERLGFRSYFKRRFQRWNFYLYRRPLGIPSVCPCDRERSA